MARPSIVMFGLTILQRVTELAVPPGSRTRGPEKWQKWQSTTVKQLLSVCPLLHWGLARVMGPLETVSSSKRQIQLFLRESDIGCRTDIAKDLACDQRVRG